MRKLMLLLLISCLSAVNGQDSKWFNVVMNMIDECCCELAMDVASPYCVGSPVVLTARDPRKVSQQWMWQGGMLINRLTGFALTVDNFKKLKLGRPEDLDNQKFSYNKHDNGDRRLAYEKTVSNQRHYVDTATKIGPVENVPLGVSPMNHRSTDQFWDLLPVGQPSYATPAYRWNRWRYHTGYVAWWLTVPTDVLPRPPGVAKPPNPPCKSKFKFPLGQ